MSSRMRLFCHAAFVCLYNKIAPKVHPQSQYGGALVRTPRGVEESLAGRTHLNGERPSLWSACDHSTLLVVRGLPHRRSRRDPAATRSDRNRGGCVLARGVPAAALIARRFRTVLAIAVVVGKVMAWVGLISVVALLAFPGVIAHPGPHAHRRMSGWDDIEHGIERVAPPWTWTSNSSTQ